MSLSDRERQIAELYAGGSTYKQIAARLHIAPATVRNHIAAVYRKLEVGNKAALVHTLALRLSEFGLLPPAGPGARTENVVSQLDGQGRSNPAGPSIAVMPFTTIGPLEHDHLGHGFAADIQHDLTRHRDLVVAGRSSCLVLAGRGADARDIAAALRVEYVLQGTIRADGRRVRVTAELVDGASANVVWSERFDRTMYDILDVEAEVARAISSALALSVEQAELDRRRHLDDDRLSTYDLRLRGNRLLELGGRANLHTAARYFRRALELEPHSAANYAGLSMCYGYECDLLLTDDYARSLRHHIELAERAVAVDESDSRGHYAMACALMLDGQYERADAHAARGLELSPSEYHNLCNRGYSLMALGRTDESVALFDDSLRRNPLAPTSCLLAVGLIEYHDRNYGQSAHALSRMKGYMVQRASTLAAACAQVGYEEAARSAATEFQRLRGDIPICPADDRRAEWPRFWRLVYPFLTGDALEHVLEGIRKAALPA